MKMTSKDWQKLQGPILLLLLVIIGSVALITTAMHYAESQQTALTQQQDALLIAKQKYLSSGAEKQQIETYLPKYRALIEQGFIGEEQRQVWIQALHQIQKQHQLFPIQYQLAPLEQKQPDFVQSIAPFEMHQSTMQLSMDLLHEGDVLTLTESLSTQAFNNWLLRECQIERLQTPKANGATMAGQCTLEWYTLLEPATK